MAENSSRHTVKKVVMVAAGAAATVAIVTGAAGTAAASAPASTDVQTVAAAAPANSALGATLARVSATDTTVSPQIAYERW